MWSHAAKSDLPAHLSSFLAGVFAAVAVSLFTEALFIEKVVARPAAMAASISLFLLASAGAAVVAWCLDDMHGQWVREGRPVEPAHVEDIVKERSTRATIAIVGTVIASVVGGYLLYLASLLVN